MFGCDFTVGVFRACEEGAHLFDLADGKEGEKAITGEGLGFDVGRREFLRSVAWERFVPAESNFGFVGKLLRCDALLEARKSEIVDAEIERCSCNIHHVTESGWQGEHLGNCEVALRP